MTKALITGATGFVGGHLAVALAEHGVGELVGVSRDGTASDQLRHSGLRPVTADLLDTAGLRRLLSDARPDWILHLAGYAHGGRSFREPNAAWEGNLTATRSLYDAVSDWGGSPRILFVSTGLVYGDPSPENPAFTEDGVLAPVSPYAASKAAADLLSFQVTRHPGLDVLRVRPFNHIGPGQSAEYAVANFARQIAAAEAGEEPPVIETGDLSSSRDFTDVRDIVRAYVALMEHGETGEAYNAATGRSHRMQDVLSRLVALSSAAVEVRQKADPDRKRDVRDTRADASKLKRATGWQPQRNLDESLSDVLEWWRKVPSSK